VCYEEHRWWWRCWALGASTGFFMISYFVNYFILKLKVAHFTTLIVYTVFAGVISLSLSLMTGALALFASFSFNRAIFKKINID
jgi:transmembrane 9 superfamily member 2/4